MAPFAGGNGAARGETISPARLSLLLATNVPRPSGAGEEPPPERRPAASLRDCSDALLLWRLCDRATCKRAKTCSGDAERCLTRHSPHVPLDARHFIIDVMNSLEFGYTFDEALKQHKEGARAYVAWSASVIPERERHAVR
jgi:hypothetical protein